MLRGILIWPPTASCAWADRLLPFERQATTLYSPLQGSLEAKVPARALKSWLASPSISMRRANSWPGPESGDLRVGGAILSSRLIDGQFPNYRQLIPESADHELTLSAPDMNCVVRRISLLAHNNAPLRLAFSEGELTVSAQTPDVGEARRRSPCLPRGAFQIGLNPEFPRDRVESIDTNELVMKLISPLRPGPTSPLRPASSCT